MIHLNDVDITKIGLGTWLLGGDVKENPNNDDEKDINAIKSKLNFFIRYFFLRNYIFYWYRLFKIEKLSIFAF